MNLAETQALFHELLTAPTPEAQARIEGCFAGTAELPAQARIGIYADMYLWRLADALRATFPDVARLLGDERFLSLAEAYVRRHPSEHHDVAQVGRRLPAFLRDDPDPDRSDLADLAELEWARQEVFFAPAAEPLGTDAFAALAPRQFSRSAIALTPALRVLVLGHDAVRLWRRLEEGGAPEPPVAERSAAAVWRVGHEVFHAPLPLDEATALNAAGAGEPLERVCEAFADRPDLPAAVHAALSSWIAEGWIVRLWDPISATSGPSSPRSGA